MKIISTRASMAALCVAGIAALATAAAQAAPLPAQGNADVRTTAFESGARSVAISASDGRFAERDYDSRGTLQHELVVVDSTLTEYTPRTGTVVHHSDGALPDDRIDQWEPVYRSAIDDGTLKLVGDDVLDNRPVHVLALGTQPHGIPTIGPSPSASYRLYVDATTWAPLRAVDGTTVLVTATDETVPLAQVEQQLAPSRPGARAARAARKTAHHTARHHSKRR